MESESARLAQLLKRAEDEHLVLRVENGLLTAYEPWARMPLDPVDDGLRYADVGDFMTSALPWPGAEERKRKREVESQ